MNGRKADRVFSGDNSSFKRHCGIKNVNTFIGDIAAKNYMETTEAKNWASKLLDHLISQFPAPIKVPVIKYTDQNMNAFRMPDLIHLQEAESRPGVIRSFSRSSAAANPCRQQRLQQDLQNHPEARKFNTQMSDCGKLFLAQYCQIPKPQLQVNIQWAHKPPPIQFDQQFKIQSVMAFLEDDGWFQETTGPGAISGKPPQNEQQVNYYVLISYVMYKCMSADWRSKVPFKDYMHAAECNDQICNCPLYLRLTSHFDACSDLKCSICGLVRTSSGTDDCHKESRKRKECPPAALPYMNCGNSGPVVHMPPKRLKIASQIKAVDGFPQEFAAASLNQHTAPDSSLIGPEAGKRSLDHTINESVLLEPVNPTTQRLSSLECDSLAPEKTKNAGLELEKIKRPTAYPAQFFTAAQIKEHLASFAPRKDVSDSVGENTCQFCSMDKLVFGPAPIYCSSCEIRIKRNVAFYRSADDGGVRYCFCTSCFKGSRGPNILIHELSISKANLQKAKNDEGIEDSWVLCDKCQRWQHRVCGLYNAEIDAEGKADYVCPKCCLEEIESGKHVLGPQTPAIGASKLPRTSLSDHIEQRLSKRLKQEREQMAKISGMKLEDVPGAEGLVVREVVSVSKQLKVKQNFMDILHGEDYPAEFAYRSKLIFLFQKIEGVDVCLFGMCVQEFGSECHGPNQRCLYISYLDSVRYFKPRRKSATGESLRSFVYHEILIGYLEYCKKRGFATCYIWACPPRKGDDYIFYCHPESRKTPNQDKLRQWYKTMINKAVEDGIVVEHTNLYNQFFIPDKQGNTKITASRLPYFDGDYWSGVAENIAAKLEQETPSKLPNKRTLKGIGQDCPDVVTKDVLVMKKLSETILPQKENFMVVHLQYICTRCHEVILSGSRWFCNQCKKFQLCSRCFDADQCISGRRIHTCHSGKNNQLSEVVLNTATLDAKEEDYELENSFFDTHDAFLDKCQKSHFQFDKLGHAKYSSQMILYHLMPKPTVGPSCTVCHKDVVVEECWHCAICTMIYVCKSCYEMKGSASHTHKLTQPSTMVVAPGTKSEQPEKQRIQGMKAALEALVHASRCKSKPCSSTACRNIKLLFLHGLRCKVKLCGGCKFCRKAWGLVKEHSRVCRDSGCKIPHCMDMKKHRENSMKNLQQKVSCP